MALSSQVISEIVEAYKAGHSTHAVARHFRLSRSTVQRHVNEAGVSRTVEESRALAVRHDHLPQERSSTDEKIQGVEDCRRELKRLHRYHPEQWRKNLIEAHKAKRAAERGIGIEAGSRSLAARMEGRSVEVRSSGNGEAV